MSACDKFMCCMYISAPPPTLTHTHKHMYCICTCMFIFICTVFVYVYTILFTKVPAQTQAVLHISTVTGSSTTRCSTGNRSRDKVLREPELSVPSPFPLFCCHTVLCCQAETLSWRSESVSERERDSHRQKTLFQHATRNKTPLFLTLSLSFFLFPLCSLVSSNPSRRVSFSSAGRRRHDIERPLIKTFVFLSAAAARISGRGLTPRGDGFVPIKCRRRRVMGR